MEKRERGMPFAGLGIRRKKKLAVNAQAVGGDEGHRLRLHQARGWKIGGYQFIGEGLFLARKPQHWVGFPIEA